MTKSKQPLLTTLRKYHKPIAAFLTVNFLASMVFPLASYALTAGPTSPETTSFEPVDTTDMVNLLTGDLAYNIPLLEVPGPSGGYPLSLSYHGGILNNEEASWVGLGWTLNPGAINRTVSGFPDDFKNAEEVQKFHWEGGQRVVGEIGISGSLGGISAGSWGISVGHDTYQGIGVGTFASLGVSVGGIAPASLRADIDPWGGASISAGAGIGLNTGSLAANLNAGVTTNFSSVSGNVGVGLNSGFTSLGASFSSQGFSSSLNSGVQVSANHSRTGRISSSSFGLTIPLPLIHLGFQYHKYWISEVTSSFTNGSIYYPENPVLNANELNFQAFDTYTLVDPEYENIATQNPDTVLGGSFPNHDFYQVNAQGLGGNIQPHLLQKHLFRQNLRRWDANLGQFINDVTHYYQNSEYDGYKSGFRFINDFSNRHLYDPTDFVLGATANDLVDYNFGDATTGESGNDAVLENDLVGSRNVKYYTNLEINEGVPGFLETNSSGFDRSVWADKAPNQIGGYVVTNESGMKYYFSLPAYNLQEFRYTENTDFANRDTRSETVNGKPYAYTWYLTAVTGPDFVDRGGDENSPNNLLDNEDWGYWVGFNYGKWTDQYMWRTPSEGFVKDLDTKFKNYSSGKKELYYLDYMHTATHTALFSKNIRNDAKSVASVPNSNKYLDPGFFPNSYTGDFHRYVVDHDDPNNTDPYYCGGNHDLFEETTDNTTIYPVSSLKLSKIYLFQNAQLDDQLGLLGVSNLSDLKSHTSNLDFSYNHHVSIVKTENRTNFDEDAQACIDEQPVVSNEPDEDRTVPLHLGNNILDIYDMASIDPGAMKVIELESDYGLVPGTPNSFSDDNLYSSTPSQNAGDYELTGKLTLNSLKYLGKGGEESNPKLPPMKFRYDLPNDEYETQFRLEGSLGEPQSSNELWENGDILKAEVVNGAGNPIGEVGYFLVETVTDPSPDVLYGFLGGNFSNDNVFKSVKITRTKNPPFGVDNFDLWGYYKSDVEAEALEENENLARRVSDRSAKNTDVWSLRKIRTNLGSDILIDYETDDYEEIGLQLEHTLVVETLTSKDVNTHEFTVVLDQEDLLLRQGVIDHLQNLSHLEVTYTLLALVGYGPIGGGCDVEFSEEMRSRSKTTTCEIINVSSNVLTLHSEEFVDDATYIAPGPGCWPGPVSNHVVAMNGIIDADETFKTKGGGVRVKKLSINDPVLEVQSENSYHYENGVTSYEPIRLDNFIVFDGLNIEDEAKIKNLHRNALFENFTELIANAREVPPPGVMYSKVRNQSHIKQMGDETTSPAYSVYDFETFDAYMAQIDRESTQEFPPEGNTEGTVVKTRTLAVKDYTSRIGSLKRITLYRDDRDGIFDNDLKISETINHYLHDEVVYPADATLNEKFEANKTDYEGPLLGRFENQGVLAETFIDQRYVRQEDDSQHLLGVITQRERFPSIMTGQTNINYNKGGSSTSTTLAFDFYSGQPTLTYDQDTYGNKYITETVPAYRINDQLQYPEMGPVGLGEGLKKNMLAQEGATITIKLDATYDPVAEGSAFQPKVVGLVGAGYQTWSNGISVVTGESGLPGAILQDDIYRKRSTYSYIGDGTATQDNGIYAFDEVGYANLKSSLILDDVTEEPDVAVGWQRNAEITLYDMLSHALEAYDVNDNPAATKMDIFQERVLATAANASYNEFAYVGFEEPAIGSTFGGGIQIEAGPGNDRVNNEAIGNPEPHTGDYSYQMGSGQAGISFTIDTPVPGNYMVSLWATSENVEVTSSISGGAPVIQTKLPAKSAGPEWHLIRAVVPYLETDTGPVKLSLNTGEPLRIDDFRVHPVDAAMTSYVYNEWGELSDVLDANNIFTHYEYNEMGSLTVVSRETFEHGVKEIARYETHYAMLPEDSELTNGGE